MAHDLGRLPAGPASRPWPTDCDELDVVANDCPMVSAGHARSAERAGERTAAPRGLGAVVFIDSGVSDVSAIVKAASADAELVMLDPLIDGLTQIARHMAERPGVKTISLLASDCTDGIRLGSTSLTRQAILSQHGPELDAIRFALNGRVELKHVMGDGTSPFQSGVLEVMAKAIGAELVEPE